MSRTQKKRRLLAALLAIKIIQKKNRYKKKRSCWVKRWIMKRNEFGVYSQLLKELRCQDSQYYKNFIRMDSANFEVVLNKVAPHIEKQDTRMRPAISAGERLALTLRFLATG